MCPTHHSVPLFSGPDNPCLSPIPLPYLHPPELLVLSFCLAPLSSPHSTSSPLTLLGHTSISHLGSLYLLATRCEAGAGEEGGALRARWHLLSLQSPPPPELAADASLETSLPSLISSSLLPSAPASHPASSLSGHPALSGLFRTREVVCS